MRQASLRLFYIIGGFFALTALPVAAASDEGKDFCSQTQTVSVCGMHRGYQPFLPDNRCRGFGARLTNMVSTVLGRHCKTAERIVPKMTKAVLCREMAQANQAYAAVVSAPPCGSGDISCLAQAADKVKQEIPKMQHHWSDLQRLKALYEQNMTLFQSAAGQYRSVGGAIVNSTTFRDCSEQERGQFRQTASQLSEESIKAFKSTSELMDKLKPKLEEMEKQKEAFNVYAKKTMEAACNEGSMTGGTKAICSYLAETQEKVNAEPSTAATLLAGIQDSLDGTSFGDATGLGRKAIPAEMIRDNPNVCLEFASSCKAGIIEAIESNENLKPEAKKLLKNYFENLEGEYLFMLADTRTADLLDQLGAAGDDPVKQFDAIAVWSQNNHAFDALLTDKWAENKELVNGLLDTLPQDAFEHRIKLAKGLLNHELLDKDPSLVVSFKNAAFGIATAGMKTGDPADALRAYQNFLNTSDPNITEAGYAILKDNEGLIRNAILEDLKSSDDKSFFSLGMGLENQNYRNLVYAYVQSSFDLKTLGKSLDVAVPLLDKEADVATLSAAFEDMVSNEEFWDKTEKFLAAKSIGMDGSEVSNAALVSAAAKDLSQTLQTELRENPGKYNEALGVFMPTSKELLLVDTMLEEASPESLISGVRYVRNLASADNAVERIGIAKEFFNSEFAKNNSTLVESVINENFDRIKTVQERYALEKAGLSSGTPLNKFESGLGEFLAERGIQPSHVELAKILNRGLSHEEKVKSLDYAHRLLGGTKDGSPPADGQVIQVLAEISKDESFMKTLTDTTTSESTFPVLKQAMRDSFSFYKQVPDGGSETRFASLGIGEKQIELVGALIDDTTPAGMRLGLDAFGSAMDNRNDPVAMVKWAAAVGETEVMRKHEKLVVAAVDESLVTLSRSFDGDKDVPGYYTEAKEFLRKSGLTKDDIELARKANQFFTGDEKVRGARVVADMMSGDYETTFRAMEEMVAYEGKRQHGRGADRDALSGDAKLLDRTITFVGQDQATSEAFRKFALRRFEHFEGGLKEAGLTDAQIRFGKLGLEEGDPGQIRSGLAFMDHVVNPDRSAPYKSIGVIRDSLDSPFMKRHAGLAKEVMLDSVGQMKEVFSIPRSQRTAYQQKVFEELSSAKVSVAHLELAEAVINSTSAEGKVLAADIAYRLAGGGGYSGGKYFPNVNTPGHKTGTEFVAAPVLPEHAEIFKAILRKDVLPGDMGLELVSDIVDAGGATGDEVRIRMMKSLQDFAARHPEQAKRVGDILVNEYFEETRKVITFELIQRGRVEDPAVFAAIDAATKEGAFEFVRNQEAAYYILGSKDLEEGYQRFKAAALAEPDVVRRLAVANKRSVQAYAGHLLADLKRNPPKDMDPKQYEIMIAGLEGMTTPVNRIPDRREPAEVRAAPTDVGSGLSFLFGGIGFAQNDKEHYMRYAESVLRREGATDATIQKFGNALYEANRDDNGFGRGDWNRATSVTVNGKRYDVDTHLYYARSFESLGFTASGITDYVRELGYQYAASDYYNPKAGFSLQAVQHDLEQMRKLQGYIDQLPKADQAEARAKLAGMIEILEACKVNCDFTTIGNVAARRPASIVHTSPSYTAPFVAPVPIPKPTRYSPAPTYAPPPPPRPTIDEVLREAGLEVDRGDRR